MSPRPKGDPGAWLIADVIRYKPGIGTYGLEESLQADGRVPGIVIGHTMTRVRVRLSVVFAGRVGSIDKCVDAASLVHESVCASS